MQFNRFFLFLFLLTCFASFAYADDLKSVSITNIPKLNRDVTISKEQFDAQSSQIEETPLDIPYLAYKIRLPKNWVKAPASNSNVQVDLSKRILGNIVEYLGPPTLDLRSSFRIRANDLSFDVDAKDWFLSYVFTNNYNLIGMDVTSPQRVQAQYVMIDNGNQYNVRAVAQISGHRIILAEYIVPLEFWETERSYAKMSMASFVLTNPDPSPIENMQTFRFVDIAQFQYPSSWILNAPPITSVERMSAALTNIKGKSANDLNIKGRSSNTNALMEGRIDISIVTKGLDVKIANEIATLKKQMLERQLVLGNLIEPVSGWPRHEGIIMAKIEAYKVDNVKSKLADYEQWVGVFETPGRYYFVSLLTVGRQDDFLAWSRNVKTYRTVISTLSPVVN